MSTPESTTYNFDIGDGRHIVVDECGTGRPILFIHGVLMSRRFFKKQVSPIGSKARFITFDLPGHGDSSDDPFGHTVTEYTRVLDLFIREKKLDDVIIVGWSMGAFVAWEYLKTYGSDLVAGVVVVDELATDFKHDDYPFAAIDIPFLSYLMETWQTDRKQVADVFIGAMFMEEQSLAAQDWIRTEILKTNSSNGCSILYDQTMRDYRECLSEFDSRFLLIFGADEKLISVAAAKDLHDRMPGSRLEIFENSGHCPFLEEPDRFNQMILDFALS